MRKLKVLFLSAVLVVAVSACQKSSKSEENQQGQDLVETSVEELDSALGYIMSYDPTLFILEETDGSDSYRYQGNEPFSPSVYLTVQAYEDMDALTLAQGVALQSGLDAVTVQDAFMGKDSIETKTVYIEEEIEGVTRIQVFYAVPVSQGALLVEIGGYVGMPEEIEAKFEEMLGTFCVK